MREHDAAKQDAPGRAARGAAVPQGLPSAIGNRAMTRMVARMEATDAVDALKESLAPGVLGAEHRVIDTMTAFSADTAGFDKVATDYEKKAEAPLPPALGPAEALIPDG